MNTYFPKKVIIIIAFALIARIIFVFSFTDLKKDYYWEYGEIAKNIIHGNGYSLFYFNGDKLEHRYSPGIEILPSAYMPPGYVTFLLPFMMANDLVTRNILILLIQVLISIGSICLIYIYTKKYFSDVSALITVVIISFLPEFIYAVTSYTPTVIYHFLIILLLLQFKEYHDKPQNKKLIFIGLIASALIYFRSEFLLAIIMLLIPFVIQKKFVQSLIIMSVVIITLIPWTFRNYNVFHEFIPLTTSGGLNFYRGNNAEGLGSWGNEITNKEIIDLKRDKNFELHLNRVYLTNTLIFIKNNPGPAIRDMFVKIYHLWVIDTSDARSYLWTYIAPTILILVLFIYGFFISFSRRRYEYIYLFFIYSTIIAAVFFTLPRYQTMIKILLIPFAAYGIEIIIKKIKPNRLLK
ncbi:MAG: glycosyltransferase family 39 protein [Ignavibacteriaceae bacterium]|nr:glycosyltransferase family 39 protein [Ignavibacteriaceae bacterium]